MFIGNKPEIIADYLPDWPYYIIEFIFFAFVALFGLYYMSNYGFEAIKTKIRKKRA